MLASLASLPYPCPTACSGSAVRRGDVKPREREREREEGRGRGKNARRSGSLFHETRESLANDSRNMYTLATKRSNLVVVVVVVVVV